jgi:hypothetical protein
MTKLLCAVLGCTDEATETVQVRNAESGEETYRDVCPKHYEQNHREELSASWDPIVAAVRMT